jgi:hypothetical protein
MDHVFTQIGQFFNGIVTMAEFMYGAWTKIDKMEHDVENWSKDHNLMNGFGLLTNKGKSFTDSDKVSDAQERLNAAILSGNDAAIEKAKQDLLSAEAVKKAADEANALAVSLVRLNAGVHGERTFGGNYGLHGPLSDRDNEVYYEHDYEGHSSQYGPNNNTTAPPTPRSRPQVYGYELMRREYHTSPTELG